MDLGALERSLAGITVAPYIVKAMAMIDRPRWTTRTSIPSC
jgi:hypothetical protein